MNEPIIKQYLLGCISQETAHITENYPYGGMRCTRREWLEFRKGHGYRFVTQTQNPKTGKWNKPHAGVYAPGLAFMYVNELGHVDWHTWDGYYWETKPIEEFTAKHSEALQDEISQLLINGWTKAIERCKAKRTAAA